ncbi:MAG: hypothetical protein VB110_05240 [Bacteroidales bacterium]|nr:hypothetical protein [Bacteroidales bacterium]
MKKRKKKISMKVTVNDYIKAVKIADREIQQSDTPGWISTHKIHPSKKTYNRRENKRIKE